MNDTWWRMETSGRGASALSQPLHLGFMLQQNNPVSQSFWEWRPRIDWLKIVALKHPTFQPPVQKCGTVA